MEASDFDKKTEGKQMQTHDLGCEMTFVADGKHVRGSPTFHSWRHPPLPSGDTENLLYTKFVDCGSCEQGARVSLTFDSIVLFLADRNQPLGAARAVFHAPHAAA